jgi:hypothetical protein
MSTEFSTGCGEVFRISVEKSLRKACSNEGRRRVIFVADFSFVAHTFFEKGVAFFRSLWYNTKVYEIPTRGTAG